MLDELPMRGIARKEPLGMFSSSLRSGPRALSVVLMCHGLRDDHRAYCGDEGLAWRIPNAPAAQGAELGCVPRCTLQNGTPGTVRWSRSTKAAAALPSLLDCPAP